MQKQISHTERISVQRLIFVALLFMSTGTALELYLLDHYEDLQQLIPLLCIGAALLVMSVLLFRKSGFAMQLFKGILGIAALSGLYGTFLHLRANVEFEQEMRPTAKGWDLFVESLSGALPALAPLSMVVLALLGYSYLKLLNKK
jgi:hypothetical protein